MDVIVKKKATLEGSQTSVEVAHMLYELVDQSKARPAVLTHLFGYERCEIWERAMASIAKQTISLKEHPLLLNSIAKMATRDSARAIRPQVRSLLSTLAKEKCQWVHMARNPHVIETLVKAAPNHVAMEILWDIFHINLQSTDSCDSTSGSTLDCSPTLSSSFERCSFGDDTV
ncbi:hypothetical protein MHU86_1697 [Fragilaria crotonensis]|nr:hypothetical protein MHU86_1697 [Fragilaria crotonensis]